MTVPAKYQEEKLNQECVGGQSVGRETAWYTFEASNYSHTAQIVREEGLLMSTLLDTSTLTYT